MAKQFFDVFPGLKLNETTTQLFKLVTVERVTATRQKDFVRIYIACDRLILKDVIMDVENEIKNQLFAGCNITIKIYEKFSLSAQYNPEKLLHIYQESILTELQANSPVEYSLFKNANISFPTERQMKLELADTVIAHEKCPELVRILEKIFCERCGIPVDIQAAYQPPKENRHRAEGEIMMARQVAQIAARAGARAVASDFELPGTNMAAVEKGGFSPAKMAGNGPEAGYGGAGANGAPSQAGGPGMDAGYEAYLASMGMQSGGADGMNGGAISAEEYAMMQTMAGAEAPFEGGIVRPAEDAAAFAAGGSGSGANGGMPGGANGTGANAGMPGGAGANGTGTGGGKAAGKNGAEGSGRSGGKGDFKSGKDKFVRGEGRGDFRRAVKKSDNPDVIYGRDFDGEPIAIEDIIGEMGEVVIRGKILKLETREIKNERTIVMFDVTDFSDTMKIKIFTLNEP